MYDWVYPKQKEKSFTLVYLILQFFFCQSNCCWVWKRLLVPFIFVSGRWRPARFLFLVAFVWEQFLDLPLYFSSVRAENFELEADRTQSSGRSAVPVSKTLVGEISTSIRLFVMAIEMHYSSEIRKVLCFLSWSDFKFLFSRSYISRIPFQSCFIHLWLPHSVLHWCSLTLSTAASVGKHNIRKILSY